MIQWRTEKRAVESLKDHPTNPRTFTEKGLEDLKASMLKLGYIDPIAINMDGTIIGGHARKKQLTLLGILEVDVRVPDRKLTEAEVREALVRLNKNIAGTWDFKVLEDSFAKADLESWGFEKADFNSFAAKGAKNADDVPTAPSSVATRAGDVWLMGEHRLMCGSSVDKDAVGVLLRTDTPHLMVTDPPYGVNYDPAWRERVDNFKRHAVGKVMNDDIADWTEAWKLFPGDVAYVWHGGLHSATVETSLSTAKFKVRSQIIWVKQHFAFSRGDYHWKHEPCWYAVREGKKGHWNGGRKQTTVWEIQNLNPMGGDKSEVPTGHGTQKPVECMQRPIENNSKRGDYIYEPFSGSGTTIIAAEITGRHCLAMELDPAYVDMAVIRWQNFTGLKAINALSGETFDREALLRFQGPKRPRKPKRKSAA